MNVYFSSLLLSPVLFKTRNIPVLQQALKKKCGEDQKNIKFTAHQNWRTPPQPTRIVSPQRQTRNLPIKISWRDKGIKTRKSLGLFLQPGHISPDCQVIKAAHAAQTYWAKLQINSISPLWWGRLGYRPQIILTEHTVWSRNSTHSSR